MHTLSTTFVLGYHGCDGTVAERLLWGEDFKPSDNEYDWLGPGVYFWESNPKRGFEYATELKKIENGPRIRIPAVIGAVINLGLCLDLTTSAGIEQVGYAYQRLKEISEKAGWALPTNSGDLHHRNLDCAVIRTLHQMRKEQDLSEIDTIKGVFVEGDEIYPHSGFRDKTHIQICVCNVENIAGAFRVPNRFLE